MRKLRGYCYTEGIDDEETECGLDNFTEWDLYICNNKLVSDNQIPEMLKMLCMCVMQRYIYSSNSELPRTCDSSKWSNNNANWTIFWSIISSISQSTSKFTEWAESYIRWESWIGWQICDAASFKAKERNWGWRTFILVDMIGKSGTFLSWTFVSWNLCH